MGYMSRNITILTACDDSSGVGDIEGVEKKNWQGRISHERGDLSVIIH